MSKFQIVLLSVFGVFILIGVMVFAFSKGSGKAVAQLTIWGPFPASDFQSFISTSGLYQDNTLSLTYTQVDPNSFDKQFTEALAEGHGPDLVIISQENIWQEKNKLSLIPYSAVKLSDFQSIFIDEGNLFASTQGLYALPMLVDPMVLYFNRDLFNSAAIATPPKYWDEMYGYADKLTEKDGANNIVKSAIALGESANIPHSKEILSMLMLQAGTPITDVLGDRLVSELANSYNLPTTPGESALEYYTQFANPAKPFYSWNRSLSDAETSFVSGDSAMYLGFTSEAARLKAKNPNLALGVVSVPQSRVAGKTVTYGKIYGVAISRSSQNQAGAFSAITKLVASTAIDALAKTVSLPPARRDLISQKPTDGTMSLFYDAALQSKAWLDPEPVKTKTLFGDMITSVTSGRANPGNALGSASAELQAIIGE